MPHLEAGLLSSRPRGCSWRCRCRSRSPWASPPPSWAPCAGCRRSRRCPWWWSCGPGWRSPPPRQARASSSSWRTSGRPRPDINMTLCLQSDQVTLLCIPVSPQCQVLCWQGSVRRAGWDELIMVKDGLNSRKDLKICFALQWTWTMILFETGEGTPFWAMHR